MQLLEIEEYATFKDEENLVSYHFAGLQIPLGEILEQQRSLFNQALFFLPVSSKKPGELPEHKASPPRFANILP